MILITGATGGYGRTVIEFLLKKGFTKDRLSALARNPEKVGDLREKVTVMQGDYDNYASLVKAFDSVEKLLFVPGRDLDKRLVQNANMVNAAREAGVRHVVYASIARKNEGPGSPLWLLAETHVFTEQLLMESNLTYTILRNNLYLDFLPVLIGKDALKIGTIWLPAGSGKVSAALRSDMAGAAAEVLATDGHENKIYTITNNEAYDYKEIAAYLCELTNKHIHYISPEPEAFAGQLKKTGVPSRVAAITLAFALAQARGELDIVSHDLADLLHRAPVSCKDYLKHFYGHGRGDRQPL